MKCAACDRETDTAWTVDLDIPGIPYCPAHKTDVQVALILYCQGDERALDELRERARPKARKGSEKKKGPKPLP